MALAAGTRLGSYDVLALIGAGGMGEVYRAKDRKLNRDVAVKVLPALFAADPERLARFQREAEVLASLNHPNIAAIYGLEEADGVRALVLELVEGPTLADVIAAKAIPVDEALAIARQIADALDAAHEKGIVHRDLKPANVKLRADGTAKVLDFGLAKVREAAVAGAALSNSPTMVSMSVPGTVLGTAAYMAPEQAKGKETDRTADVWAFGCVLYEMLTGSATFAGESVGEVLGAIFRAEPEWNRLPAETPESVRRLLRRCLQKDPKQRLRSIADGRLELDEARSGAPTPAVVAHAARMRERFAWATVALVTLIAAAAIAWALRATSSAPFPPETRLEITTPVTTDPFSFAVSPDGRRLVFVASAPNGQSQLWLRALETVAVRPLGGTEGARYPFWSPDGKSVAFFANGKLRRLDIDSGVPQTLATASGSRGGTWNADGVILFAPDSIGGLFSIPATGGEPMAVTTLAAGQISHRFPQFLPDGRRFLFYARGTEASRGVFVGSLDASASNRLIAADALGAYLAPGWLLFVSQGTLVAKRFDPKRGELSGDSILVADSVGFDTNASSAPVSVAASGLVTYRGGGAMATQLTWFDRTGKALAVASAREENGLLQPSLSPDGRRVAVYRTVQGNTDIWLLDGGRRVRLTDDPSAEMYPIWSRDGSKAIFSNQRKGAFDLYQKPSSGVGAEELLIESPQNKLANSMSPDGQLLMYYTRDSKTAADLWILPLQRERKPFPFLVTSFEESWGQFSPDGRWVAYQSDESGRPEIYVRPFPGPGGQWPVSTAGGITPRWSPDGKELYYIAPDATLMAVPIAVKGAAIDPGTPAALFQTRIARGGASFVGIGWQYDVAADGRFLINVNTESATAPITVIENWKPRN